MRVVTFGLGIWIEEGDELSLREFVQGDLSETYSGKEYVLNISFLWWTWGFRFLR